MNISTNSFFLGNSFDFGQTSGISSARSDGGEFEALLCQCKNVIISPKIEKQAQSDPDIAELLKSKLQSISKSQSPDELVIIDRRGEVSHYCLKKDKKKDYPTPEDIKETLRARARKKARLDAYFQNLEKVCVKKQLRERENIVRGKKFRASVTALECAARSVLQKRPQKNPDYTIT